MKILNKQNNEMKQFLYDYGLKWVSSDKKEGEFKLDALLNDLKVSKDPLIYKWDNKTNNMLNLDLVIDKVDLLNSKFMKTYKPNAKSKVDQGPDSIKLKVSSSKFYFIVL